MGSHPIPQLKWGYGVVQKHFHMLQPLLDIVQQLLRGGLMGVDLLRAFVSHHVQPLHRQEMTM
jgi:hypothetical protein